MYPSQTGSHATTAPKTTAPQTRLSHGTLVRTALPRSLLNYNLNSVPNLVNSSCVPNGALLGYIGIHSEAVRFNGMVESKHSPKPGPRLRARRLSLELTLRDVHRASVKLARELRNPAFVIPPSRSHDIETKMITPSIHRLYTLARVYKCSLDELLSLYGIPRR